jgi:hypothetical protein
MCLSSLSEVFTFKELGVKEVYSATKVLANDDSWNAGICKEVGLSARTRVGIAAREVSSILL